MRSETYLLSLSLALSMWLGTAFAVCNGTQLAAAVTACTDDTCSSCTTETYFGRVLGNCEFTACSATNGVAHNVIMERPLCYITDISDIRWGNVTCLMYASTDCTGTPFTATFPFSTTDPANACSTSTTGWQSLSCRFGGDCT